MNNKLQKWQTVSAARTALVFGDDRLNITDKNPTMLHANSLAGHQSKKCRIVGTEVCLAKIAQHQRKLAKDAVLRVGVPVRSRFLDFSRIATALHAGTHFPNLQQFVTDWAIRGLHAEFCKSAYQKTPRP